METNKLFNLEQHSLTNDELIAVRGGTGHSSAPANDGNMPGVDENVIIPD